MPVLEGPRVGATASPGLGSRPALDLVEGYALTSMVAALEMAGLLGQLEAGGLRSEGPDARLVEACLRYLAQRGLVEADSGTFRLSALGEAVCRDKGYLVWLVGGYGEPLRHLEAFLTGRKTYGKDHPRDSRWVAEGAAMLGRRDVVPQAMRLLEHVPFDHVLDLGCGNARFLLAACDRFGCSGVGVDISPEACAEAEKAVKAADMTAQVQVVCADAAALDDVPRLGETDLVVTFFLLHEILAQGRAALVGYLSELSRRLRPGTHLLAAEVEPPRDGSTSKPFSPEFTFVHALMGQSLLSADGWREALADGGFAVRDVVRLDMPGGVLILGQTE